MPSHPCVAGFWTAWLSMKIRCFSVGCRLLPSITVRRMCEAVANGHEKKKDIEYRTLKIVLLLIPPGDEVRFSSQFCTQHRP